MSCKTNNMTSQVFSPQPLSKQRLRLQDTGTRAGPATVSSGRRGHRKSTWLSRSKRLTSRRSRIRSLTRQVKMYAHPALLFDPKSISIPLRAPWQEILHDLRGLPSCRAFYRKPVRARWNPLSCLRHPHPPCGAGMAPRSKHRDLILLTLIPSVYTPCANRRAPQFRLHMNPGIARRGTCPTTTWYLNDGQTTVDRRFYHFMDAGVYQLLRASSCVDARQSGAPYLPRQCRILFCECQPFT